MKNIIILVVSLLFIFSNLVISKSPDQTILAFNQTYSDFGGLEVIRQILVVDKPSISHSLNVAIHQYYTFIILSINNSGTLERKNLYVSQDISRILSSGSNLQQMSGITWEPVPTSFEWGKIAHSKKSLMPGEKFVIVIQIPAKLSREELATLPKPEISIDPLTAIITAPSNVLVGERVLVSIKNEQGIPYIGIDVTIISPTGKALKIKTNENGVVDFVAREEGIYSYRVPQLRLLNAPQTKANQPVVYLTTAELSPKKEENVSSFFNFNLGDFAGIIAGLIIIATILLGIGIFLSLRQEEEEEVQSQYPQSLPSSMDKEQPLQKEIQPQDSEQENVAESSAIEQTRSILADRRKKREQGVIIQPQETSTGISSETRDVTHLEEAPTPAEDEEEEELSDEEIRKMTEEFIRRLQEEEEKIKPSTYDYD
ncbi:MAG: hypothetical protein QXN01_04735, partial [Candidatus Anstonellales archaeon]